MAHEVRDLLLGPAQVLEISGRPPVNRYWFRCWFRDRLPPDERLLQRRVTTPQRILLEIELWRGTSQRLSQSL